MTRSTPKLLPEGLRDRLPDEAEAASRVTRALIDAMGRHGYRRVAPPIAEFRETMAGDANDPASRDLLRFTDPVSRRTLAIRPDMTRQVGRIATSRMAAAPRPLRLSYAGQVVKLTATTMWPDREMTQVGAELVGSDSLPAVTEVLRVAVEALIAAGVTGITVDLTLPDLIDTLAAGPLPLPADQVEQVKARLDAKDAGAIAAMGAHAYLPLLAATGAFPHALDRLRAIDAGGVLASRLAALEALAGAVAGHATVTLDPTERHGFEYQSWIGFSIFVAGQSVTIGRGGTYAITHADGRVEKAVGFSLYPDPLVGAGLGAVAADGKRLFLPIGHDDAAAHQFRLSGWTTIAAIDDADDGVALDCTHWLNGVAAELL
ncbi:MAG: ATP phosphoribosyltransferase regulatory subunit [Sphingopyxis sp.]